MPHRSANTFILDSRVSTPGNDHGRVRVRYEIAIAISWLRNDNKESGQRSAVSIQRAATGLPLHTVNTFILDSRVSTPGNDIRGGARPEVMELDSGYRAGMTRQQVDTGFAT